VHDSGIGNMKYECRYVGIKRRLRRLTGSEGAAVPPGRSRFDLDQCTIGALVFNGVSFSSRRKWPVVGTSGKWGQQPWQRWIGNLAKRLFEALLLGTGRLKYLAYYVGSSELRGFVRHCRNQDNLLARRILALGLDPYEVALSDPALVCFLRKLCALCDNRKWCGQDLTRTANDAVLRNREDWRDYCENAFVLDMLAGLQSRSGTALK
jgi:hypothetical protein